MLRGLLGVGEQVASEILVLRRVATAPPCPRDGANGDPASLQTHHHLRGRPDELKAVQLQIKEVGRRVQGAERAVQIEGPRGERQRKTLGKDHLEGVARTDVFADPLHLGLEVGTIHRAPEDGILRRRIAQHERRCRSGAAQTLQEAFDLRRRGFVAAAQLHVAASLRFDGGDGARTPEQVVDGQHRSRQHEQGVGDGEPPWRRGREVLDMADHVVAEEPDRPTPETGELRHGSGGVATHQPIEVGEGVGRELALLPTGVRRPPVHPPARQAPSGARLGAEKGVPSPRLPTHHRLQQKAERRARQLVVRGHRGFRVEDELGPDGNQAAAAREAPELVKAGEQTHDRECGRGTASGELPRWPVACQRPPNPLRCPLAGSDGCPAARRTAFADPESFYVNPYLFSI